MGEAEKAELPEAEMSSKQIDILLAWQATNDDKTFRLLLLSIVSALLYGYFGLLAPYLARMRSQHLLDLDTDLQAVTQHFNNLQTCYAVFVGDRESGLDPVRAFRNRVIPAIHSTLDNKLHTTRVADREALGVLQKDMESLSHIYRDFAPGWNPYAPISASLSKDGKLEVLANLAALDTVISNFRELAEAAGRETDAKLAEAAKEGMLNPSFTKTSYPIDETITATFSPWQKAYFISLRRLPTLRTAEHSSLHSAVRELVQDYSPPFEVNTIADLEKFRAVVVAERAQRRVDEQPFSIEVPFLNMRLNRIVAVLSFPTIILFFLHMMAFYSQRSALIARDLNALTPSQRLSEEKYRTRAPYPWLEFSTNHDASTSSSVLKWSYYIRERMERGLKILVVGLPLFISCFFGHVLAVFH